MANKQITGTVELTTGAFTPTSAMPVYQGENGATELQLTITKNGIDYVLPVGASLWMYFYYEVQNQMTLSILMTVTGNVATCEFNDVLTALAKRPTCVVRELNAEKTTVLCTIPLIVSPTLASTVIAISPVTPDMMRHAYINTENGHWMQWDETSETYVDSGVNAAGDGNYVAFISQSLTTEQKAQARLNIGASGGPGASTAIQKGDGNNGFAPAVSGDDYIPPIGTTTAIKKGDGAKGLEDAVPGEDFALPSGHYTALLDKDDWVGASAPYTQAVTVTGLVTGDKPIVDLVRSATQATAENEITAFMYCLYGKFEVTATNQLTVTCYDNKPTVDLNLNLVVVK